MSELSRMQALYQWFSQFGTVYAESAVRVIDKSEIEYPYGTYELTLNDFGHPVAIAFNWWDRTPSLESTDAKIAEVDAAIGRDGVMIPCAGGGIRIAKADPFARPLNDGDDNMIRRIIFNLSIEYEV